MNLNLILLSFLLVGMIGLHPRSIPPKKPINIILMMADNLGYGDVGCYGSPVVETFLNMLIKKP